MSSLWPIARAFADDDNREHTHAGTKGTVRCGTCGGTGSRGEGETAIHCDACDGEGEVAVSCDREWLH